MPLLRVGVFTGVGATRVASPGSATHNFPTTVFSFFISFSFSSNWEEASCVLLRTEILEEWVDCRGVSTVPCLRAQVNLTGFNQTAFLHFDEELVLHALEVGISAASSYGFSQLLRRIFAAAGLGRRRSDTPRGNWTSWFWGEIA